MFDLFLVLKYTDNNDIKTFFSRSFTYLFATIHLQYVQTFLQEQRNHQLFDQSHDVVLNFAHNMFQGYICKININSYFYLILLVHTDIFTSQDHCYHFFFFSKATINLETNSSGNPFQLSVAFHIETIHMTCSAIQTTGFYMKCNTGLK